MRTIILAQGTTFILGAELRDRVGAALDLSAATFVAQMRDALNAVVATLSITTVVNRPGCVQISYAGDTAQWPVGRYRVDLRVTWSSGLIQNTETWAVCVVTPVTQAAGGAA